MDAKEFLLKPENAKYSIPEIMEMYSGRKLELLQSKVHKITGDGEVMKLFNEELGVAAS